MNGKKAFFVAVLGLSAIPAFAANNTPPTLTGDPATACQVILCLSTGQRPTECTPPIQRYFSIQAKYWADTIRERKNFLDLCPAANQTPAMSKLTDDIANGAGQCDSASLNNSLRTYNNSDSGLGPLMTISDRMPTYCTDYLTNPLTNLSGTMPKYVGTPDTNGFWVDPAAYSAALAQYNARQAAIQQQQQNAWDN